MSAEQRLNRLRALQEQTSAERQLAHSEVAAMEINPRGGVNSSYQVRLTDGQEAIFKPLSGVDQRVAAHYGHRPEETLLHECATWQLAKLLGPPYSELVPACVWREFQGVWGDVEGVLTSKVSGDWFHFDRPFAAAPDQCMAAALFDSLSAQQDRHAANYLWDEPQQQLHLIDHGYSFAREGDPINITMFVAWRHTAAAQLTTAERELLHHAQTAGTLREIALLLEPERAACLHDRAARLLHDGRLLGPREFGSARALPEPDTLDAELADSLRLLHPTQSRPVDEAPASRPSTTPARRPSASPSRGIRPQR